MFRKLIEDTRLRLFSKSSHPAEQDPSIETNALMQLAKKQNQIESMPNFPLKRTTVTTLNSLNDAYFKRRPAKCRDIINAALLGLNETNFSFTEALITRGAFCRKDEIAIVERADSATAEYLNKRLRQK